MADEYKEKNIDSLEVWCAIMQLPYSFHVTFDINHGGDRDNPDQWSIDCINLYHETPTYVPTRRSTSCIWFDYDMATAGDVLTEVLIKNSAIVVEEFGLANDLSAQILTPEKAEWLTALFQMEILL